MAPPAKKFKKKYVTWSSWERRELLDKRIERDALFTSKNANANEGWKKIAAELHGKLGEEKTAEVCKTQWNALMKKYKSFFKYRSGDGTGEEAVAEEANDWEFFERIHSYASSKDNYHPPLLMHNVEGAISMQPNSQVNSPSITPHENHSQSTSGEDTSPLASRSRAATSRPSTSTQMSRAQRAIRLEEHILKRERKVDKNNSSLLAIFGQMVQTDYPHIDASALLLTSGSESD